MENCRLSFEEADRITEHQSLTLLKEMRDLLYWYFERHGEYAAQQKDIYNAYVLATAFTAGRVSGIREERARKRVPA